MCSLVLAAPLGVGVALALDYVMLLVLRMLLGAALAGAFLALYVARECPLLPPRSAACTFPGSGHVCSDANVVSLLPQARKR